ncbi:MAG: GGDEF domain-containing protein [Butyrivibrio sp.]|nr:GGDEF domain-containing protein [Butyrivibrio sp.]
MKILTRLQAAVLSILAIGITAASIIFLGGDRYNTPNRHPLVQLEEGWTLYRGDTCYDLDSLSNSNIGMMNKYDSITLVNTLPEIGVTPATLHFRSFLSTVEVYLDAKEIYSYGKDYADKGKMIPKVQNYIPLPDDYAGKQITIIITSYENNAFSGLSPITLGDCEDISAALIQNHRLPLSVGAFMCVFSFLMLVLSPYIIFYNHRDYSIIFSAGITLILGIYVLCFNDLFSQISDRPALFSFIEYIVLFMIPGSIMAFVLAAHQLEQKEIGIAVLIFNSLFVIITAGLHLLNFFHLCEFVSWLHIISIVEGLLIIAVLVINTFKKARSDRDEFHNKILSTNILIFGLIITLLFSIVDIIKYNIFKYIGLKDMKSNIDFMTVGALIFSVCLLLNYFYHCIEYISEETVKKQLEGLAYTDALTGLYNRTKCELTLASLKGKYTIISFDLDYLKYTNDNYGHAAGDELLRGFADLLRQSFFDATLIGRMGGDEFLVILPYVDDNRTENGLALLTDLMADKNYHESNIRYSASWGYASSESTKLKHTSSAQSVYLLADKRMFIMKKAHHNESLGRLFSDLLKDAPLKGGV